jgi:hypothetical protein
MHDSKVVAEVRNVKVVVYEVIDKTPEVKAPSL